MEIVSFIEQRIHCLVPFKEFPDCGKWIVSEDRLRLRNPTVYSRRVHRYQTFERRRSAKRIGTDSADDKESALRQVSARWIVERMQRANRVAGFRLELEAREADAWRSEDDQVIPFSNCGPQVSRYGPISRAGQRMQASVSMSTPLSAISAASDKVVQVKDILHQPLPTAAVQPTKGKWQNLEGSCRVTKHAFVSDQPMVSRDDVDPSQIVSSIPQVFKVAPSIDSSMVDEKLEKLVEVKSK